MVKSLDRALSILEYLSKRKSAGVTEVATEFAMDKATISRIMQTFEKHGLVTKNEGNSKYQIGSGVLKLSYNTLLKQKMITIAHPSLVALSEILNTTARLCMVEGKKVFIIDQALPSKGKNAKDADIPGINKPMYCSAIGKTILAYMAPSSLESALEKMELIPYTENTIVDKNILRNELCQIREQGYALNIAEFSDRTYCIAVPVFVEEGKSLEYCIGITGWTDHRKNEDHFKWIIQYMKKISHEISIDYANMVQERGKVSFTPYI